MLVLPIMIAPAFISFCTDGALRLGCAFSSAGVAPEVGEAVFEPGRRGDPDDGYDGAGLGLALARRLARTAGGDVVLAGTGRHATFDVLLPPG